MNIKYEIKFNKEISNEELEKICYDIQIKLIDEIISLGPKMSHLQFCNFQASFIEALLIGFFSSFPDDKVQRSLVNEIGEQAIRSFWESPQQDTKS